MIKNALQYRVTKAQIERFEESLRELEARPDRDELSRLNTEAMRSQLDDLRAQIAEYQSLETERPRELRFTSLDDIANLLIKARIASGLSQKQLAETLGMKEQQIQRYEATDFESASLARILEIADALGLSASGVGVLSDPTPSNPSQFLANLQRAGIDRALVLDRLLPEYLAARFANGIPPDQSELRAAASSVARVFGWESDLVLSGPLEVDPAYAGVPRFKVRKGADVGRATAYTVYAHYLALLVLECVREIAMHDVPTDPKVVRGAIVMQSQRMTFETVLEYVWSLGIPVLPLNDPGAFQAACWRANRRNVIVLKQQSQSLSRWAFDVLHEIWHLGQEPDAPLLSVIELGDATGEEWAANQFAGNVLLDGRAEELAEKCVAEARNSVERLKSVVRTVARREGVESDALANYMAYRLSFQGIDWWGAAANLQAGKPGEPWRIARDFLLERISLERLDPVDRNLLRRALQG